MQILEKKLQYVDFQAGLSGRGPVFACDNLTQDLFDIVNHFFHRQRLQVYDENKHFDHVDHESTKSV